MFLISSRWSHWDLAWASMLFVGKREYNDFLNSPEGISTNILADRLKSLVAIGLCVKERHPTDGKRYLYEPTDKCIDLIPVLVELSAWGYKHLEDTFVPPEFVEGMKKGKEAFVNECMCRLRAKEAPLVARPVES